MDISVIICTFNRCESLRRTLQTCCELDVPTGVTWELLVVDNNSKDATRPVSESFAGKLPVRYVFEPRQGKSIALNRVINEATGNLLVYSDDDVDVERAWLKALIEAAHRHPEVKFFGGRVIPEWEIPPPRWVSENSLASLNSVFVRYDLGNEGQPLDATMPAFFGANLALRREVFDEGYRFDETIGPQGREPIHGEEAKLQSALLRDGKKGLYVPGAVVHHRNARERMTEAYVRQYFKGLGRREIRLADRPANSDLWLGVPRWHWKTLALYTARFLLTRWTRPSAVWLKAEIDMSRAWGAFVEFRSQHRIKAI